MAIQQTITYAYPVDRTVIAVQDVLNDLGWDIIELTSSRIVVTMPGVSKLQVTNFPQMVLLLEGDSQTTNMSVSVNVAVWGTWSAKKPLTGMLGRFTNALSLRVQTDSVAINPTVAIGEGQGVYSQQSSSGTRDRVGQLKDLKELLDSGVLTEEEFAVEKARILSEG